MENQLEQSIAMENGPLAISESSNDDNMFKQSDLTKNRSHLVKELEDKLIQEEEDQEKQQQVEVGQENQDQELDPATLVKQS